MNHTYEGTYKNARAMWVRHVIGFIVSINSFLDIFGILDKNPNHKYMVYEAYIDDVNKHKKKIDGQGNSIFFRICFW